MEGSIVLVLEGNRLKHPSRIFRPVRSNRRDPLHTLASLNESSTRTIDRGPW